MSSPGMAVNWEPRQDRSHRALGWQTHQSLQTRMQCRGNAWGFAGERTCVQVRTAVQTSGVHGVCDSLTSPGNQGKDQESHSRLPGKFFATSTSASIHPPVQCTCCVDPPLQFRDLGAYTRVGAMDTHVSPQVPAKYGQIPQSARSWQGMSLRCRSVEKDADAECLLSHRVTPCWLRNVNVPLSAGASSQPPVCCMMRAPIKWSSLVLCDVRAIASRRIWTRSQSWRPLR